MFSRLGRFVVRFPWLIVVAWVVAAGACFLLAPSLKKVGAADETSFLPKDAESVQARALLARAFPAEAAAGTATLVLHRAGGLVDADRTYLRDLAAWMTDPAAPDAVRGVVTSVVSADVKPELAPMLRSEDGTTEIATVNLAIAAFQQGANDAVTAIRDRVAVTAPAGLEVHLSGQAGIGTDYLKAIADGTDRTTVVTIVLVVLILLLIYRAPLAALVPLITIGAGFLVARGVLGWLAAAGWTISTLLDWFIVVLVFGVGTDYTIFLVSRYREELARVGASGGADGALRRTASLATVERIGAVITASAATVVVGLASMAVASFGMIQTTGPALALAIVVTLVAGLTLAPALLLLFGRALFWPRHPKPLAEETGTGAWHRIAAMIVRRPLLVSVVVTGVLLVPIVFLPNARSNFDVLAELPEGADSRVGFDLVAAHFDRGQLMPVSVVVEAPGRDLASPAGLAAIAAATETVRGTDGVARVRSLVDPAGTGAVGDLRPSVRLKAIADGVTLLAQPGAVDLLIRNPASIAQLTSARDWLVSLGKNQPWLADNGDYRLAMALASGIGDSIKRLTATPPPSAEDAAKAKEAIVASATGLSAAAGRLAELYASRPQDDWLLPTGMGGEGQAALDRLLAAYLSPDHSIARLVVLTVDDAYASGALATVGRLRAASGEIEAAFGQGSHAVVGGAPAEFADIQDTIQADFRQVAVITVLGIFLVLVVLLRSVVAPAFLVATVLISNQATLHLAGTGFQEVLGHSGTHYFLPLIVFVLLVALGSDYNIFVMSRIREESRTRDIRHGIRIASARTGTVVTSAGIILAGTFGSLMTAPLQILFQVGAAVAMGVLIDTFIVRSLLVPALTAVLGDWSWWPTHRRREPAGPPVDAAGPPLDRAPGADAVPG